MTNAGSQGQDSRPDAGKIIDRAATVLAPITVITALLAYVGWVYTTAYFGYFGISEGVVNLSLQNYLFNSAAATFGAVAYLIAAIGLLVFVDRLLLIRLESWTGRRRGTYIKRTLAIAGLVLAAAGSALSLGVATGLILPILGPTLLGIGAVVAFRFGSTPSNTDRSDRARFLRLGALFAVLALALFWAATLYANDSGQRAANAVDLRQTPLPVVTVYTKTYLDMPGIDGVVVQPVTGPSGTSYRYTRALLLTYTNGRWLLITGKQPCSETITERTPRTCYRSSIYILRDSDTISVEVDAPGG